MTDSPLVELMYLSRRTIPRGVRGGTEATVERIAEGARGFNRARDVTGVLIVGKRCFAQILEGPESAVDEIFEKRVLCATSHTDVLLLSRGPVSARSFHDWNMAIAHDRTDSLDRFVEHRAWEIRLAGSLSEPPSPWPLDLLFDDVFRIAGRIATAPLERRATGRAAFDAALH